MDLSNWQQFESLLYELSAVERKDKKDEQLISPATYQPNSTRANANVVDWAGWAAVDVDDHVFEGNLENELYNRYGDWYYICYSTASSTVDHPKFRLVFPLKTSIGVDQIKKFWFALNTELGSIGDRQTKDLSRMYYIPANFAGSNNFIFTNPEITHQKEHYITLNNIALSSMMLDISQEYNKLSRAHWTEATPTSVLADANNNFTNVTFNNDDIHLEIIYDE